MLTLRTPPAYLLGHRRAALRVARDSQALVMGVAIALATGWARPYHAWFPVAAPWDVFVPVIVSTVLATWLYLLLWWALPERSHARRFGAGFLSVLRMCWWATPITLLHTASAWGRAPRLDVWMLAALWWGSVISNAVSLAWRVPAGAVFVPAMLCANGALIYLAARTGVVTDGRDGHLLHLCAVLSYLGWFGATAWGRRRSRKRILTHLIAPFSA